jgi:hypothetical protein
MAWRQLSRDVSPTSPATPTPALFTTRSTPPHSSSARRAVASTSSSFVTSQPMATTSLAPRPRASSAVASAVARRRSESNSRAPRRPSSSASALPRPLPAPVMTARQDGEIFISPSSYPPCSPPCRHKKEHRHPGGAHPSAPAGRPEASAPAEVTLILPLRRGVAVPCRRHFTVGHLSSPSRAPPATPPPCLPCRLLCPPAPALPSCK